MKLSSLLLIMQVGLGSQHLPQFTEQVHVIAGSVLVRLPRETSQVRDLEVLVNGAPAQVLGVRPLLESSRLESDAIRVVSEAQGDARPPQLVPEADPAESEIASEVAVVVMSDLCDRICRQFGTSHLQEAAHSLALLGPVRVMATGPRPRLLARGLRTESSVRDALERIRPLATTHWMISDRREAFAIAQVLRKGGVNTSAWELMQVRRSLYQLALALEAGRVGKTTIAFVLTNGFDSSGFSGFDVGKAARAGIALFPWERPSREWRYENEREWNESLKVFARGLAAEGFVLYFVFPGIGGMGGQYYTAENRGSAVVQDFMTRGYDLGLWSSYRWLPLDNATAGPREVATVTGGQVIYSKNPVSSALRALEELYIVEYQTAEFEAAQAGAMVPVSVSFRSRPVEVISPYVRMGRSKLAAEASTLLALEMRDSLGMLPVKVEVTVAEASSKRAAMATLLAHAEVGPIVNRLKQIGVGRLRVTVAVHMKRGEPFVHQEEFEQVVAEGAEGTVWTYEAPIKLPKEAERLAVVVEELQTGAWGAAVVDLKGEGRR